MSGPFQSNQPPVLSQEEKQTERLSNIAVARIEGGLARYNQKLGDPKSWEQGEPRPEGLIGTLRFLATDPEARLAVNMKWYARHGESLFDSLERNLAGNSRLDALRLINPDYREPVPPNVRLASLTLNPDRPIDRAALNQKHVHLPKDASQQSSAAAIVRAQTHRSVLR